MVELLPYTLGIQFGFDLHQQTVWEYGNCSYLPVCKVQIFVIELFDKLCENLKLLAPASC